MRIDLTPEQEEQCFFESGFRRSYLEWQPKSLHVALLLAEVMQRGDRPELRQSHSLLALTDAQRELVREATGKDRAWIAVPHPPRSAFKYEEAWQGDFEPVCLGRSVAIVAGAAPAPCNVEHVIRLDPEAKPSHRVFGTGTHPTTQLLLTLLQERIRTGDRVVDVGAGSGILAIAAARFGASDVLALDTDEIAAAVAVRNVELNQLAHVVRVRQTGLAPQHDGPCDLIVLNLPSAVVISLLPALAQTLRPDGLLLAGGFTGVRLPILLQAAGDSGFTLVEQHHQGNWIGLVLRRDASSALPPA